MTKEQLLEVVKKEKLSTPLLNIRPFNSINTFGYYKDGKQKWNVYETDDRAIIYRTCIKDTEEKAIEELLSWLRDQKYIDGLSY